MTINLISDSFTKPSPEMLHAMLTTKVGNDVFDEDPTVNELQRKLADLFGMQEALFFPSGSMANQTAINLHTRPAEQVVCDKWGHVYNFEGGGAASNSGVSFSLIDGNRGMFTAEQLVDHINPPGNIHISTTSLVAVENTTNKGGGACWDIEELQKIREVCDEKDLAYHLDGARLFNALIVKNHEPKQYGDLFDTISICLSKSFGAPIGSVLIGNKKDMMRAKKIRKLFGGAMCQVGYMAAAGIYALDNNVERLKDDHERARLLGEALQKNNYIKKVEPIETNIIIFNVIDGIDENFFIEKLKESDILISSMGNGKLRMVTHLDFNDDMLDTVINKLNEMKI